MLSDRRQADTRTSSRPVRACQMYSRWAEAKESKKRKEENWKLTSYMGSIASQEGRVGGECSGQSELVRRDDTVKPLGAGPRPRCRPATAKSKDVLLSHWLGKLVSFVLIGFSAGVRLLGDLCPFRG